MANRSKPLIRSNTTSGRRLLISAALLAIVLGVALFFWLLLPFWRLAGHFAEHPYRQPSRLYGRSVELARGDLVDPHQLVRDLRREGYREVAGSGTLPAGRYRRTRGSIDVHLRVFPSPDGRAGGRVLSVGFEGRRISRLESAGHELVKARLEPPLLASYYGDKLEERRPVVLDALPEEVIEAVLAAEDDHFFEHAGLSVSGILRAAWVNLRGGEIRQGGSTLTQQLVKNLYLSQERTVARKLREAILAVLLEARYSKREILEAYLNEIYLGASNGVNVIGVGAAARAYFSKEARQLDLGEAAVLAGMIRSPATLSPVDHPEAARRRRDQVLDHMVELGWVRRERAAAVEARPVTALPNPVPRRRAPYFADAVAEEAARRFGIDELRDRGYVLLSTLSWSDQQEAREAVHWGVPALEKGWQKGAKVAVPLQAALVSIDPASGGVLAYVGGRDYAVSQFDRAGQAHRQAGSAFKPVVYAAAFDHGFEPSSFIEDAELTVAQAGNRWTPRNYDGSYHGRVTARTALEESYNVATARLALEVGLSHIVKEARRMGISTHLEAVPALALGAFEVTPVELAGVYATLANGGARVPVHGLEAVFDAREQRVEGEALAPSEQVLSPQTAYLVTSVLQGVLDRGTGAGARRQGVTDALAGKTGTTNGRRDNWFAGYAPNRVTVVWVGYDDNSPTRMSGARAALPIWARFTRAVRPPGGYPTFPQPPGIVTAVIDPTTGELATDRCPEVLTEVFREGDVPSEVCHLHRGFWAEPLEQPDGADTRDRRHPFRRWLEKVFGRGGDGEDGGR